MEKKQKQRQIHSSQVAGPSHKMCHSVFADDSDSSGEGESNEARDYDTIHPPSPKVSKGGIVKKTIKKSSMQDMSNTQNVSLIDINSTAGHTGHTEGRACQSEGKAPSECDVPMEMSNGDNTEKTTNRDELSSDVDIAPSGIVARPNEEYESDEGYLALPPNSNGSSENTGKEFFNTLMNKIFPFLINIISKLIPFIS